MKSVKLWVAIVLPLIVFTNCKRDDIIDIVPDKEEEEQTDPNPSESEEDEKNTDTEGTDATFELTANDLELHPMQDIAKPGYLETIIDPSFGTTIRRITDAGDGNIVKPMYSTIQAWNADESLMILYERGVGHQLLNGMDYSFIRYLDIRPKDIEQIYWDFNDPDVLYYIDDVTADLIKYTVSAENQEILVNLQNLSGCDGNITSGDDVQMMSWDSDVIGFRCENTTAYYYRISSGALTEFAIDDLNNIAPMPGPSGETFYHNTNVYGVDGNHTLRLNEAKGEHSCIGTFANGGDAHFAVAFDEGPNGGCIGNIVAHDLVTGECFNVISEEQGYDYSKSGTHISAVAHKNPGYIAASMIGFEEDGQALLDQELILARVDNGNVDVYRIGHHRADEKEFDYFGEPHAVISPTGTRVLFGSDWSGVDDGKSVDSYVVELPAFQK